MDRKEDLLKMLNKAVLFEESFTVIFGTTYCTFIEGNKVAGLTAAQKQKAIKILNRLIEDSKRHGKLLRDLIKRISPEGQNAS